MGRASKPNQVRPNECIWIDDGGAQWYVRADFARVGSRVEVVGLEVRSFRREDEPHLAEFVEGWSILDGDMPPESARRRGLPTLANGQAAKLTSDILRDVATLRKELRAASLNALQSAGLPANWSGSSPELSEEYEDIARVYFEAKRAGLPTTPAVKAFLGSHLTDGNVRQKIRRARAAGWFVKYEAEAADGDGSDSNDR